MVYHKADVVNAMAQKTGMSKTDSEKALLAFLDYVSESLVKKDTINITGFGSFTACHRDERKSRNPKTGETIIVPARTVPKFSPGKGLKDAVNV